MLGDKEDCAHLFLGCPFAKTIWNQQPISIVDTTSEMSLWESIRKSGGRRKAEGIRILAVLWAIWMYWNDKLFNGRAVSIDRVAYAVKGSCGCVVLHTRRERWPIVIDT